MFKSVQISIWMSWIAIEMSNALLKKNIRNTNPFWIRDYVMSFQLLLKNVQSSPKQTGDCCKIPSIIATICYGLFQKKNKLIEDQISPCIWSIMPSPNWSFGSTYLPCTMNRLTPPAIDKFPLQVAHHLEAWNSFRKAHRRHLDLPQPLVTWMTGLD